MSDLLNGANTTPGTAGAETPGNGASAPMVAGVAGQVAAPPPDGTPDGQTPPRDEGHWERVAREAIDGRQKAKAERDALKARIAELETPAERPAATQAPAVGDLEKRLAALEAAQAVAHQSLSVDAEAIRLSLPEQLRAVVPVMDDKKDEIARLRALGAATNQAPVPQAPGLPPISAPRTTGLKQLSEQERKAKLSSYTTAQLMAVKSEHTKR